ncbi:MAG: hypothetical protein ACXAC6_04475 [Candidatus Hodarchaeales archaeon]|jgi:tetratricopeptide (TPR) repeat protein
MKQNLITELWSQGKTDELIAAKDYIDALEGEEKVNSELMWAYCILEQHNDSETYHRVVQKYLNQELQPRSLLNVKLHQAAYVGWLEAKFDEALVILDQCESLYEDLTDDDKGDLLFLKAWFYHLKGTYLMYRDQESSLKLLNKGLSLFENNPDYTYGLLLKSALLVHIGNLYLHKGDYDKAEEKYNYSIDFAKQLGNEGFSSIPLSNISHIYSVRGEIHKALRILNDGYDIAIKSNTSRVIAELLGAKGTLFVQLKKYRKAFDCYNDALIQAKRLKLVLFEAKILNELVMVLCTIKDDN